VKAFILDADLYRNKTNDLAYIIPHLDPGMHIYAAEMGPWKSHLWYYVIEDKIQLVRQLVLCTLQCLS
jgi:hypothetical protein